MTAFENDTNDDLRIGLSFTKTELIKRQMSKSKNYSLNYTK
jgi:hypothetical protein